MKTIHESHTPPLGYASLLPCPSQGGRRVEDVLVSPHVHEHGMRVASKVSSYCSGDHHVPNPRIDPNTSNGGATYLSMVGWHYFKDIYTDEFLRVGRRL